MRIVIVLACVMTVRAGWILEQQGDQGTRRIAISDSAWKSSQNAEDVILNFASGEAYIVDHFGRSIVKTTIAEYRKQLPNTGYGNSQVGSLGSVAAISCTVWVAVANQSRGYESGWASQEGCVT